MTTTQASVLRTLASDPTRFHRVNRGTGNALVRLGLARAHRIFPHLPPTGYRVTALGQIKARRIV